MKIRKIIVYLCVFAAAASIFTRIIYVNKVYPSVKIQITILVIRLIQMNIRYVWIQ